MARDKGLAFGREQFLFTPLSRKVRGILLIKIAVLILGFFSVLIFSLSATSEPLQGSKPNDLQSVSSKASRDRQTLVLSSRNWTITTDLEVPEYITLKLEEGACLTIPAPHRLTINGKFLAPIARICFGDGAIVFNNTSQTVYPQWWGAKGDGYTDDTYAIQKAIDAGANIYVPEGVYILGKITTKTYYLENCILTLHSNLSIAGSGEQSILKLANHMLDNRNDNQSNAHMMGGGNLSDVSIRKIKFDMNGSNNLTPAGKIRNAMALRIAGGENVNIEHCLFYNCAGHNVLALGVGPNAKNRGARIIGNIFKNGGRYVGTPKEDINNPDFSFVYVEWEHAVIQDNTIEQEDINIALHNYTRGVEIHGSHAKLLNNKIIGCDPAVYIATAPAPIENVEVRNNSMHNCARGISFFLTKTPLKNVIISSNVILLNQSTLRTTAGECVGIPVANGAQRTFSSAYANAGPIIGLKITNNDIASNLRRNDKYRGIGMVIHSVHDTEITQNRIVGMTGGGITFVGSPWGSINVDITKNTIFDCGEGVQSREYSTGIFFAHDGYSTLPPQSYYANNIRITDNSIGNTKENGPQYRAVFRNLPTTKIEHLYVGSNKFVNLMSGLYDGNKNLTNLESPNQEAHYVPY